MEDYEYTEDITCPYCGYVFDCDSEFITDDGNEEHIECYKCDKTFIYTTNYSITFSSKKCDCLNNGKHNYKYNSKHKNLQDNKNYELYVCKDCGKYDWREKG
jgi:DNA-directed RNA polymerase subunit RPC12/RpoP